MPVAGEPDVRIELGTLGEYERYPEADYQTQARRTDADDTLDVVRIDVGRDGHRRVRYADGADFVIDAVASRIYGQAPDSLTLDDMIVYLQGPILGHLLRLRGVTCMHASGAVISGRAIAVVGDGGLGKSTTAGAFARLGLPVLTDDVLALDARGERVWVRPGLPRVLLWPSSVTALFGTADALPRCIATWEKCYLTLGDDSHRFAREPAPLGAVYILSDRLSGMSEPQISELSGSQAIVELVARTYAADLLDGKQRREELDMLGQLVRTVPVRKVICPDDATAIEQSCRSLIDDFEKNVRPAP